MLGSRDQSIAAAATVHGAHSLEICTGGRGDAWSERLDRSSCIRAGGL